MVAENSNRSKEVASIEDYKSRLEREFYRLLSDLAFCKAFLSRDYLLTPMTDPDDLVIHSASNIFYSCSECLFLATARLWGSASDEVSFRKAKRNLSELWSGRGQIPKDYHDVWNESFKSLCVSEEKENLLVLRDEEFGHNILRSRSRNRSELLRGRVGTNGLAGFSVTNGALINFSENSARLLFQTIFPFTENELMPFNQWPRRFDIKLAVHCDMHGASLDRLKPIK